MLSLSEYTILERINTKGSVSLYRAERSIDRRKVILKILEKSLVPNDENSLINEYKIAGQLSNKGIARYLKIETSEDQDIVIMENLEGISLQEYLQDYKITIAHALKIAIAITEILEYLNTQGLAHQGICPANLFIDTKTLEINVIDLRHVCKINEQNTFANPAGLQNGQLEYISPEQTGRIKSEIDIRSDLYSLGIILYEMVTGKVPFATKDSLEIIHCHMAKKPVPPHHENHHVPFALSGIILKLLAKNVTDRYQSPYGLKMDLQICLDQLNHTGSIQLIELGKHDFSGKIHQSGKIYGREKEVASLQECFERVSTGVVEVVLVEGHSGVGKSALVHQARDMILQKGGIYVEGKFNQLQRNIPYYAFIQAFKEFTDYILMQAPEKIEFYRNQILEAVGVNGRILTDIIPHLELLIGDQPPLPELETHETQNRVHYVFVNFIRCISLKDHPLVIFFDDVHWADAASSNLVKIFTTDKDLHFLLFIGAYRANDILGNYSFGTAIAEMHKEKCVINKILLNLLSYESCKAITGEMLDEAMQAEDLESLAKLVFDKSHGNPFFIIAFLKCLYTDKILTFDFYASSWIWDSEKTNQLIFSGDIVDLMTDRIQKLPAVTQELLKLAACLGYLINVELLMVVAKQTRQDIDAVLKAAMDEGLILISGSNYKFLHDRIQQAAYTLVSDTERKNVHLKIGFALLKHFGTGKDHHYIFEIVNQLNAGITHDIPQRHKDRLAELNLFAGVKAKNSAAYKTSFEYLQTGIELLDISVWKNNYKLGLPLYTEGAESGFLSGHTILMEKWIEIALKNSVNVLDQVKLYDIKIKFYIAQQQLMEAVQTALKVLELLQIRFPKKPGKLHVVMALLKIKMALWRTTPEDLVNMPLITKPDAEAAIRLLSIVGSAVYFAKPDLFPLFVCKAFSLMIKHGNSNYSGVVCSSYGVILIAGLGNINAGYRMGKIAEQLAGKYEANNFKYQCKFIVNDFIVHWKEHWINSLEPMRKNYWDCLETGNPEFASYSAQLYCNRAFLCGRNLKELTEEMLQFLEALKQLRHEVALNLHRIHTQAVLNLQLEVENPTVLTGEVHNEEEMLELYKQTKAHPLIFDVYLYKLILAFHFEKYEEAILNSREARDKLEIVLGDVEVIVYYFYDTLTKCAVYHLSPKAERRKLYSDIIANLKKFRRFSLNAPMNCLHKLQLMEAEFCRINGKFEKASSLYEAAILTAKKNEYYNDLALAYELAGKYYESIQRQLIGNRYLGEAYKCYHQWGALAKVKQMKRKYGELFNDPTLSFNLSEGTIAKELAPDSYKIKGFEDIDLHSIMKAASAISSEVQLENLLKRLIRIAVENTGAQQGYLILKKDDELFIEAQGSINGEEDVLVQSFALKENQFVSEAIIRFVCLTKESLVIGHALDSIFSHDPVIDKKKSLSILCTPILHHGDVLGLLYFENNLITDAFSPDRIELLKLLSGQIAISLLNALNEQKRTKAVIERENLLAQINLHEQELLKTKLEIQEQTFNNISAEIHDNIGQTLSFIKLSINTMGDKPPEVAREKLVEVKSLVSKVIQDLRDLARTFNKDFVNKVGLVNAIDQQIQFLRKTDLYQADLFVEGDETKLESHQEIVIFRIVQELLNNVVKHANATVIKIIMQYLIDKLIITVQDNGHGFNLEEQQLSQNGGLGLSSIQSRINLIKGTVFFQSKIGEGTTVRIELKNNFLGLAGI